MPKKLPDKEEEILIDNEHHKIKLELPYLKGLDIFSFRNGCMKPAKGIFT